MIKSIASNHQPPNHQLVETDDGSFTAYSERFGESCHSTSGATSETKLHYIGGCQIKERGYLSLNILEVGFGMGIGFLETHKALTNKFFSFTSMEIDEELVKWVASENEIFIGLTKNQDGNYELKTTEFELLIIIGDARKQVPLFLGDKKFHAVYQDAFSPKRNPWLWTREWFELLFQHAHKDCILSTYSASSAIRKALISAGWKVTKGDKFGTKRSSTRAKILGASDEDILLMLERSGAPELTDAIAEEYGEKEK